MCTKCTHKCITKVQSHISTQRQKMHVYRPHIYSLLGNLMWTATNHCDYETETERHTRTYTHMYTQIHTAYQKNNLYHTLRRRDSQILVIICKRPNTHTQSNKQARIHTQKTGTATASLNQLPKVPTKCTGSPSYFKTLHNLDARQFYCFMEKGRWKKKKKQRE